MKRNGLILKIFLLITVVAALCLSPAIFADDPSPNGEITAGGQTTTGNTDSSKFQEFRDIPKGLVLFNARYDWDNAGLYYFHFDGLNFGYKDQEAHITWGKKSLWKIAVDFSENPRWFSNTAKTLYNEPYRGYLSLPDAMQTALQADATLLPDYIPGAHDVNLRYIRQTGKIGMECTSLEDWTFSLNYSNEFRKGNQPYSLSALTFNILSELPVPIRYRTQNWDVGAEWAKGKWYAGIDLHVSRFDNDVNAVRWDNPLRITDAVSASGTNNSAATPQAALPPDNRSWNLDFNGGVRLPHNHQISASISWGKMKQNMTFLPFSTNTALMALSNYPSLPAPSADAKINTFLGYISITGDPIKWFGYSVRYRKNDMKNKTPYLIFDTYAETDATLPSLGRGNSPVGWKQAQWEGEVHFTPVKQASFGLSYNSDVMRYQFREEEKTRTNLWKLTTDLRFSPYITFHGSYSDSKRRVKRYNELLDELEYPFGEAVVNGSPEGSTKFDVWSRNTRAYNALLAIYPIENFSISLNTQYSRGKYPDAEFGLSLDRYKNYGIDLSYTATKRINFYGSYMNEKYRYEMASRYRPVTSGVAIDDPANDWWNLTSNKIETYTIGVKTDFIPDRFDMTADFAYSNAKSNSDNTYAPGGVDQGNGVFNGVTYNGFPVVYNRLKTFDMRLNYHIKKNFSAAIEYMWEKWNKEDWANDVMDIYMAGADPSTNKSMFLGARVLPYNANLFRIFITMKF